MSEYPLPLAFIESMRPLLSGEMDAFLASYQQPAQRGVRFRDARRPLPANSLLGDIPYARNACYLSLDSNAGAIPLHEAGAYYLQEPSAMAAAAALRPQDGDRVLDLCAAPGGKSTQLAMSAHLSLLIANRAHPLPRAGAIQQYRAYGHWKRGCNLCLSRRFGSALARLL